MIMPKQGGLRFGAPLVGLPGSSDVEPPSEPEAWVVVRFIIPGPDWKVGRCPSKHLLSIKRYLGSKKWRRVGVPGKLSWQTKMAVGKRAWPDSSSRATPRAVYSSSNAFTTVHS